MDPGNKFPWHRRSPRDPTNGQEPPPTEASSRAVGVGLGSELSAQKEAEQTAVMSTLAFTTRSPWALCPSLQAAVPPQGRKEAAWPGPHRTHPRRH